MLSKRVSYVVLLMLYFLSGGQKLRNKDILLYSAHQSKITHNYKQYHNFNLKMGNQT